MAGLTVSNLVSPIELAISNNSKARHKQHSKLLNTWCFFYALIYENTPWGHGRGHDTVVGVPPYSPHKNVKHHR